VMPTSDKKFVLERCQHGDAPLDNRLCSGEAGYGLYAYVAPAPRMRAYYSSSGEAVYRIEQQTGVVVDLTRGEALQSLIAFAKSEFSETAKRMPGFKTPSVSASNIQRFGSVIERYVNQFHPDAAAYLVPHKAAGIPTGTQAVIRNLDAFNVTLSIPSTVSQPNIPRGLGW
jgi:hypothetical protein